MKAKLVLMFLFLYIFSSIGFCIVPKACAQSTIAPVVSLFAKVGTGDYYTIYSTGLKKEDSYVGGFKSVQLDPQEENIYFYDTVLKVVARINILDGKIYNVIGKPKSSTILDYKTPVKFTDASLGTLTDFTFDKYGNIYILVNNNPSGSPSPRLLKASLKDKTLKEVLNFETQFKPGINGDYSFSITLTGLSYDQNRYIYAYGNSAFPGIDNYGNFSNQINRSATIYRFDLLSATGELFGAGNGFKQPGFNPKYIFNPANSLYFTSVAFDHTGTCYLGTSKYLNSEWVPFITKLVSGSNNDGTFTGQAFVGDGTGSISDIGDGGQAKSAYAGISGANCFCADKNGDIYFADIYTNRVRKILNDSGLITTAVGGGTETLTYGQFKSPRLISLQSPNSILVDKSNNLYIAENNRILTITNLIVHDDKLSEQIKIANLAITKIAGNQINNPKGDISLPDLKLDYTFSGDQSIEVKGDNIPDGTNVKLLSVNTDGTTTQTTNNGKLTSGIATIPVKIEAGTTKIIKAETDPFIPAPGVYLPGTAPQITVGQLSVEPQVPAAINRDQINLLTKDASNTVTKENLIPYSGRFGFSPFFGWKHAYFYDYSNIQVESNAAIDPDNNIKDATLLTFGAVSDAIYFPNLAPWTGASTFTVWMRTDSGSVTVPIGIGPYCNMPDWTGCGAAGSFAGGNPTNYAFTNANVTNTWQKFTITSDINQGAQNKTLIIGGLGQTNNKKIYVWGARLEKSQ
ncbi:MAG: hypothetical protein A3F80_08945 [Candidatus Melainabacteria bacterium RIFCSPLOWO2_12_FULL_35_11]|nr:MAG: hypothetical protein A3F80_08945 [Candidatus Melainabacteria bacterium RIFCSPLOWO2_12_FULL_35_11]